MKKLSYAIGVILFILVSGCERDFVDDLVSPKLVLSSDTLIFDGNETHALYLSTKPLSECSFQIISYPKWVDVYPQSGTINRNIKEISIASKSAGNSLGETFGELIIMSTLGVDTVVLQRTVGGKPYSIPDSINFSVFNDCEEFVLFNRGDVELNYVIEPSDGLLTPSALSGSVVAGKQEIIKLNVNRDLLETGVFYSEIFITLNDVRDTISVRIENLKEQKQIIFSDVIDAEYSKARNLLVYVSADLSLNMYNPALKTTESIPLFYTPTCLSLSLDGEKAVVGHDGHVTYVDLSAKKIIKTNDVSCEVLDIVLAEKWAYAFPKQNQWSRIHCINLELEGSEETLHSGSSIYAGTKAKLHPSGKYIYGADNNLFPSDLEKYDIRNGTASYMYDSPYHGDYEVSGDLWFSEDGRRIFTKAGVVFKTSETKGQDMLYNGSIKLDGDNSSSYYYSNFITWLDHSEAKKSLFLISSSGSYWEKVINPFIYIYNSDNLIFRKKIELEKYLVKGEAGKGAVYAAEPYFVFSNSENSEIYAVTKAAGSGLLNDWAIQTISVE